MGCLRTYGMYLPLSHLSQVRGDQFPAHKREVRGYTNIFLRHLLDSSVQYLAGGLVQRLNRLSPDDNNVNRGIRGQVNTAARDTTWQTENSNNRDGTG